MLSSRLVKSSLQTMDGRLIGDFLPFMYISSFLILGFCIASVSMTRVDMRMASVS